MYTIGNLPTFVTLTPPPDRSLALSNPRQFSTDYMAFNVSEKTFANTNMPYAVSWMSYVLSNTKEYYNSVTDMRNRAIVAEQRAIVAEQRAISAQMDIESYVIPSDSTLNVDTLESILLQNLENTLDINLYVLNNNKGIEK